MRPTDPRLRRHLVVALRPLLVVGALGVLGALLLIAQAWAVTSLVLAVLHGGPVAAWAGVVAGLFLARGLVGWGSDAAAARAAGLVGRGLRRRIVATILGGTSAPSGSLAALATRGVTSAEPYLTRYVPALVLAGVLPVLTLVALVLLDPASALIVLVTLPLIPVFGILVGLATRDRAESQWRALADLSGHFLDVMRGLPTLVAFRRARAQSRVISAVTDRYRRRTLGTLRIAFASSAILETVATISVALVAVTVGIRLASGHLDLRTALVVLLLAPEAYWPLRRVGAEFHAAAEGVATFDAVAELPAEVPAGPTPAGPPVGGAAPIHVSGLSVVYPGRARPALGPVTLDIPARGVTAVVGPSGCGKSTLLAVLSGRLAPTSGYVAGSRPDQIALLPQRPVFVAGTLAENLRLARPEAGDDELWQVLRAVALADRVASLPGGLTADLAEDGRSLSAGERARLALARVVLSDRPWVLLDEPTAHLDELTERVVAETVRTLGRERAVVVVAHRPALVELADHVVTVTAAPAAVAERRVARIEAGPVAEPAAFEPAESRGAGSRVCGGWGAAVLNGLASMCGVALTATAGWLIVRAADRPAILTLTVAMVGVRTFGLARPALRYVERLWSHDRALRLLAQRRVAVYDALVPLVPGRLGRRRGDVLAAVVDDVDTMLDREIRVRIPVRGYAVASLLAGAVAALFSPVAAGVVAATAAVAVLAFVVARAGAARAERAGVTTRAALSDRVVEATQAADELHMWGADGPALDRVDDLGAELAHAATVAATWLGAARALVLAATGAAVAGTALLLHAQVADGRLSGAVFALLLLIPLALAEAASGLADAGAAAARSAAAERRLVALTTQPPAVSEPASPRPAPTASSIEVNGVRAHGRTIPELRIRPGDDIAVVGPSGAGKSTLAALLLRFLDPEDGAVTMSGERYAELAADTVRERVGLVDDDPHVFASTLAENVRLARPGASDADVEQALRRAHLGGWMDALPAGLHTRLGDGHAAVSGGERARLAVARSLLADQPVLVLDEPTAHLDSATAAELAREVLGTPGRSTVWITHARAGLDLVDQVVEISPSR
jgi:ATP-binding cassette, subfamily C, bacterial CydCD